MCLARDLFLLGIGEQIPTIQDYTDRFAVSRGVVQSAWEALSADGSVQIGRRGMRGSFLEMKEAQKLFAHTGWGLVTGTMPIPLTPYFTSLATGLCEAFSAAPFSVSFAYMSGSSKRADTLADGVYDFMVSSRSAARLHEQEHPELKICAELKGTMYSPAYRLYFLDPDKKEIEDDMRIGVDPACRDQKALTEWLVQGRNVTIVEYPFIGFEDLIRSGAADGAVFRDISWNEKAKDMGLRGLPIPEREGFREEDMNTPVLLIRRDNYGMDRLLRQFLDLPRISRIQQEVLAGKRSMRFS